MFAGHRRRSGWNSGGRMARAEGGSVPSGELLERELYGEGCPIFSRLRDLEKRRELPQRGPGRAENGFSRILKATERSFLYLYDKICGGQFALSSPYSKFWGACPSCPPVIYAHVAGEGTPIHDSPSNTILFSFIRIYFWLSADDVL